MKRHESIITGSTDSSAPRLESFAEADSVLVDSL